MNLELPYSNENLKYINGLLVNMGNMLMLQKSSIVSSLILIESTKNMVTHLITASHEAKPKIREKKKVKQNLPLQPTPDLLGRAMQEAQLNPSYF